MGFDGLGRVGEIEERRKVGVKKLLNSRFRNFILIKINMSEVFHTRGDGEGEQTYQDQLREAYEDMIREGFSPAEAAAAIGTDHLITSTQYDEEIQRGDINQLFTGRAG